MGLSIDREKVINEWETVLSRDPLDVPWDLVDETVTLLKEQEPVQVVQREIMHMLFWCCGSCGVAITEGDKFCRMCGKAVKWSA